MLNELYQLSRNLQQCGIVFGTLHQDVKTPGKGDGFIIEVDKQGQPVNIEFTESTKMAKLWTIRKGKHNSFPYVKIKPLWDLDLDDSLRDYLKYVRNKKETKNIYAGKIKEIFEPVCNDKELNKHDVIISKWAKTKIQTLRDKDEKLDALLQLSGRLPGDGNKTTKFIAILASLFLQKMQAFIDEGFGKSEKDGKTRQEIIETVIIGKIKKEKGKEKAVCDVPLFFDISDWPQYSCRVADPAMGKLVGANLPSGQQSGKLGISALEGQKKVLHLGPYPDPTLPAVGIVYLFSMNEVIPCHDRYRLIGSKIFPSSRDAVATVHGALQWCVADERRGKTWQGVPNMKRKQDLLISYLEEKPENAIELASLFAAPDIEESITAEAVYENKSKTVCDALRGAPGLNDNSQVNVLVISKVDEGRAQVVLSTAYSRKNIIQSVEGWTTATDNRPSFSLWLPGKKGEKAKQAEPSSPSPTDVMKCFQNQWIKNGLDKRDVTGLYLRHVYDLYLGDTFIARQAANNFLTLSLQRLSELLIGYGGSDHISKALKFEVMKKKYSTDARKTVLNAISILAITLYKLGIKKEVYMKNAAFNVGRMLALADKLHCEYCINVRGKNETDEEKKKSIPAQLIGNALMRTALDNPLKGLSLLSERLLIYQAWATKAQGDNVGLAKWVLGQMGHVSAELENADIPRQADDAVKAQILLGYLAHIKNED
ncbi:MAG: hypothetical protein HZC49_12070 [Nitrospirae bacterium]|nr:hypothetical protein [Nitrospirota bacterium]